MMTCLLFESKSKVEGAWKANGDVQKTLKRGDEEIKPQLKKKEGNKINVRRWDKGINEARLVLEGLLPGEVCRHTWTNQVQGDPLKRSRPIGRGRKLSFFSGVDLFGISQVG